MGAHPPNDGVSLAHLDGGVVLTGPCRVSPGSCFLSLAFFDHSGHCTSVAAGL